MKKKVSSVFSFKHFEVFIVVTCKISYSQGSPEEVHDSSSELLIEYERIAAL